MIAIPANIKNLVTDHVRYIPICNKTGKKLSIIKHACYANYIYKLTDYSFECIPLEESSLLSKEDFELWINYCIQFGFMPHDTVIYREDNKNCVVMNTKYEYPHRVYAGLCCYRFADSLSPMIYEAVRLIEKLPKISFYRIFHYLCGKHVINSGHGFIPANKGDSCYYTSRFASPSTNLAWALAPKYFFGKLNLVKKEENVNCFCTTMNAIYKLVEKLPSMIVDKKELLDDKWENLFQIEDFDVKNLTEIYKGISSIKHPDI